MKAGGAFKRGPSASMLGVLRGLAVLLTLLPVALGFLYVRAFGVDVPFGDTWIMVERFEKLSQGTLGFQDLWVQHYEHRLLFPKIALLLLGAATSFDNVADLYLTMAFFLLTLVVLLVAFRNGVSRNLLLFVPIAFVVFSLRQWFNMFSAIQIAFPMTQAFAVLAFYLLHVSRRGGGAGRLAFAGAMASGVVSSYSLLVGLFVWPVGLVQLLVQPVERRAKRVLVLIWTLAGVAVWVVYFFGLELGSSERERQLYFYNNPSLGLDYFLTALGSPLYWKAGPALVGGVLLALVISAALFFVYRARKFGECSFWLALIAFSLACLASMAAGRGGGGLESAMQSRYITFSSLALVGAFAVLLKLALEAGSFERGSFERGSRAVAVALGVLSVLIIASVPFSYWYGLKKGRMTEAQRTRSFVALTNYSQQPDERLDKLHRPPEFIREKSYVLCRLGYSLFSEPRRQAKGCRPPRFDTLSPAGSPALARVETVAGRKPGKGRPIVVPEGENVLKVSGWAVDEEASKPAGGVYLRVDDKTFPAFYGDNKPNVAARLGDPDYALSGFERALPVSEIGPGKHELSVVTVGSDRKTYHESTQKLSLEVK